MIMQDLIFLLEKALIRTIMVLLSLFSIVSSAQHVNLVRNYSFEDYSVCPGTMGDFENYVSDWYNPDVSTYGCTSPDYFNTCCPNNGPHSGWAGVPNNAYGSQVLPIPKICL